MLDNNPVTFQMLLNINFSQHQPVQPVFQNKGKCSPIGDKGPQSLALKNADKAVLCAAK